MSIEYAPLNLATITRRVPVRKTVGLERPDLRQLVRLYNRDQLMSGNPCTREGLGRPNLWINLESPDTTYEIQFWTDSESIKVIHRGEVLEHSDYAPQREFVLGLADRYFATVAN